MKSKSLLKLDMADLFFKITAVIILIIWAMAMIYAAKHDGKLYVSKYESMRALLSHDGQLMTELVYLQTELEDAITGRKYISAPTMVDYPIRKAKETLSISTPLSAKYYEDYIAPLEESVKLAYSWNEAKAIVMKLSAGDKTGLLKGNPVDLSNYGVSFDRHRLKVARTLEEILLNNMRKALMEDEEPKNPHNPGAAAPR